VIKKKKVLIIMVLMLMFTSSIAFAGNASDWFHANSNVYYQYENNLAGADYDALRWYNGNNVKVEVTYKTKLRNGGIVTRVINLSSGETSASASISAGERVNSVNVKRT